jgi:hypothetical protein
MEIRLDGDCGYSACKVYEDDKIYISLGGTTSANDNKKIAIVQLKDFDIYVIGSDFSLDGEATFVDNVQDIKEANRLDNAVKKIRKYAIACVLRYLEKKPHLLLKMINEIKEEAYNNGKQDTKTELRNWLKS